ncbi:precorrin-2 C(20)-methyltransferase [Pseudonocardiaceae bacterium YIM PH 21723]|nr:precorrin-2 C(20)-methyltransferase [Pseudonocardiaceae bacterium YIM PH 21723]
MTTFIGVGVGPGDPDLLTIKAVNQLREADRIFVPVLDPSVPGRAEMIIRPHLPDADARIERLVFAMSDPVTGPQRVRKQHWSDAANTVAGWFAGRPGSTAVFCTLGDPAVYSTFGYLADAVRDLLPQVKIEFSPGITAAQGVAALAGITLSEGTEPLTIVPVSRDTATLRVALNGPGTVVAYKGGRRLADLIEAVGEAGAADRAVYAEHIGSPDQKVLPLSALTQKEQDEAPYLSTVVILPLRGGRGEQL